MHCRSPISTLLRAACSLASALLLAGPAHAALLEGVLEPGQVIKKHAEAEADCENCHSHFKKQAQDEQCVKCHSHEDIGRELVEKKGYHGRMKRQACAVCHADHKGRDANIMPLDEKTFDHKLTDFELLDKHVDVKCEKCHLPKKKHREAPQACYGCHKKDDKHKGALGEKCEQCHNAKSWKEKDVFFDHDKTKFPLKNAHADPKVRCADCHPKDHYKNTPIACVECHRKDDDQKGHKGKFGPKCEACHVDKDWKTIKFDHDKDTKYPLKGKHKTTKCEDCHTGNDLYKDSKKLKSDCIACHKKDDKHKGSEGDKCEKCHTEKNWKDTPEFDHNKTKFPLKGAHGDPKVKCDDCHKSKVYTDAPKDCWSCHKKDDDEKGHRGKFGKKCEDCHTEKEWKTPKFDHDKDTKYPLRGKHKTTKCVDCHTGDVYKDKLKDACIACHKKDDKHKGKEGDKCEQCHWERDWKTTKDKFDHGLTRFPLLGKHADKKVKCDDCHNKSQEYSDAKVACVACHKKDDDDKGHKGRLGKLCEDCHNAVDWKRWDYDHDTRTHFKIDGAHKKLNCYACHSKPTDDAKLPMACVACHETDDVHGGSFSRQCERCHVTKDWRTIKSRTGAREFAPMAQVMPWIWTRDQ